MLLRRRVLGRVLAVAGAAVLVGACQPIDSGDVPRDELEATGTPAPPARGAPATAGLPGDIEALLSGLSSTAGEWQASPVPVEVVAGVDGGVWGSAAITYLAPDADRFLLVTVTPDGTSQQRPTLETFGLQPITGGAIEAVPSPDGLMPPAALLDSAADLLDDCDVDEEITTIIYTTGAPAAWDGTAWTEPLAWEAVLSTADGEGATVDARTGRPGSSPCL
jgi:hypothetical protein